MTVQLCLQFTLTVAAVDTEISNAANLSYMLMRLVELLIRCHLLSQCLLYLYHYNILLTFFAYCIAMLIIIRWIIYIDFNEYNYFSRREGHTVKL